MSNKRVTIDDYKHRFSAMNGSTNGSDFTPHYYPASHTLSSSIMTDDLSSSYRHEPAVQTIHVDQIFIRDSKALLVFACIQLCISLQLIVFAMICKFYEGCGSVPGIWIGVLCGASAVLGIIFVKYRPKKLFLRLNFTSTFLGLVLTLVLFGVVANELNTQENELGEGAWDTETQAFNKDINHIVESTKIAMNVLQLVFAIVHAICCIVSLILLGRNLFDYSEEVETHRGYYVVPSPMGHQTVLVPIEVTNAQMPENELLEFGNCRSTGTQTFARELQLNFDSPQFTRPSTLKKTKSTSKSRNLS